MYEFRDGKVKEHLGSVEEFLEKRRIENLQELERRFSPAPAEAPQPEKAAPKPAEQPKPVSSSKEDFAARKAISKEGRKLRNRVDYLEKEIAKTEKRMGEIEKVLADPGKDDDIMELTREYLENKRALDAMTDEWGELIEKIG